MQRFIDAVTNGIQQKNWYGALGMALTLPDICGRLENPNMASEKRFVAWWDKYLLATYTKNIGPKRIAHVFLSGADAYALRCSYLHEGSGETLNQRARDALERFHFVTPRGNWIIHRNQSGKKVSSYKLIYFAERFAMVSLDGLMTQKTMLVFSREVLRCLRCTILRLVLISAF